MPGLIRHLFEPLIINYQAVGPSCIGRRIKFHEPAVLQEKWKELFPQVERFPVAGMTGVIVELPGALGGGPRVKWDDGLVSWIGASAAFEMID